MSLAGIPQVDVHIYVEAGSRYQAACFDNFRVFADYICAYFLNFSVFYEDIPRILQVLGGVYHFGTPDQPGFLYVFVPYRIFNDRFAPFRTFD